MQDLIDVIYFQSMMPDGFLNRARENSIDLDKYNLLKGAIDKYAAAVSSLTQVDRLIVACLYNLCFELENTIPHYERYCFETSQNVKRMVEELGVSIDNLFWGGLESYYENI